jgi:hypothetical protein
LPEREAGGEGQQADERGDSMVNHRRIVPCPIGGGSSSRARLGPPGA